MSELRSASNPMGPWEVAKDFFVPEGLMDSSWSNDVNPSVHCEATLLTLYWDTEDNSNMKAEGFEGTERFFVLNEDGDTLYLGSDLEKAIRITRTGITEE